MNALCNHLWQSTLFAAVVALATLAMRRNSPRTRYWFWLAASVKFLLPFSLLVWTGSRIELPARAPSLHAGTVEEISNYFAPVDMRLPTTPTGFPWPSGVAAIWLLGVGFFVIRWFRRWRTIRKICDRGTVLPLRFPIPALSSPSKVEPGVFGIFNPILLMPEGLADHLTLEQLNAVLVHESQHILCRDNLTAAVHMCVETLFWFDPLVWWIGARMIEEREKDCDEAVLRQGSQPGEYAQGIVTVCRMYMESPLSCAAGISGSELKKRVRGIMTGRKSRPVTFRGKVTLTLAALVSFLIPFAIGIVRAQSLPAAPEYGYEAVSIRKAAPGQIGERFGVGPMGGLRATNMTVMLLLQFAYDAPDYRFVDAPGWVSSEHYDIVLTPDTPDVAPAPDSPTKDAIGSMQRNQQRLRAVLRDRFGLVLRLEKRELPLYVLTQVRGGSKLSAVAGDHPAGFHPNGKTGHLEATRAPINMLTSFLSRDLGRPVNDQTGLVGFYDFELDWNPQMGLGDAAPDRPSLVTALSEQLGLRLESQKGPVQVYVIENIQRPSDN
ncbi:MAG TPA: M56 family metallopeptidase [Bryobacteraceae bacterium]|jgi:uncharacterized protein (TIGR03435 family)|nr:M56 family metallopeptidase [Bryobacteraceae bacterium]